MAAVEVRNGYKFYGKKSNPKIILNYLNMNVMRGSIYGLLGASGCGKTTLLSCIVGQRQLNSGDVYVLGVKPGVPGSGIPGSRIGYMPQEIALVSEMTVKEIIYYFGRIYGLTDEKIREKFKILRDLLQLPSPKQLIKKCSGGQQRRISFACAMIHEPELLILDEPTVGLDPMLREKIWDFLVETTRNSKMAVIITTHYIEEAKQANCIGLMRNGVLLAEDSPTNIMLRYESNSIEEAFLILSQTQGDSDIIVSSEVNKNRQQLQQLSGTTTTALSTPTTPTENITDQAVSLAAKGRSFPADSQRSIARTTENTENTKPILFTTRGRIKALMTKNFVQLFRQPSGIIFMLLFPIIQLSCFYLAIGKTPTNLKLGVVNNEIINLSTCFDRKLITVYEHNDTCEFNKISCRFITELGDGIAQRVYYNSTEEAFQAAKRTDIVGYLHFPSNFSESMRTILEYGRLADDNAIDNAELRVHIDMTDQQIAFFVERKLRDKFSKFMKGILSDCNLPESFAETPVQFQDPVHGSFDIEFQQYVAPGVVMTYVKHGHNYGRSILNVVPSTNFKLFIRMVFFLATLMTAAVFISERMDGVWDRTLVAGVSATEMLWAHLLTQLIIMAFQSFEVIMYIGLVFDTYNKGDTTTLIGLLTLTAFCGMLFGLLISVYCKSHTEANFVATGAFYPMIILCGLLWPLEGMPKSLQDVVMFFPFTIPSISARNIIEKGWSITNGQVYNGFIVMTAWIVIFFTLCIIGIKRKS